MGPSSGDAEMVYLLVSGCIFHTLEGEGNNLFRECFVKGVLVARYGQALISNTPCLVYIYCILDSVAIKTGLDISNLQVDL